MAEDQILLALIRKDALSVSQPPKPQKSEDLLAALETPPAGVARAPYLERVRERNVTPPRLNYLELEAGNSAQGRAGEAWVLEFERASRRMAGNETLSSCG